MTNAPDGSTVSCWEAYNFYFVKEGDQWIEKEVSHADRELRLDAPTTNTWPQTAHTAAYWVVSSYHFEYVEGSQSGLIKRLDAHADVK